MSGRDTNFYYSFLVLPAEKRRAIVAVWDFCRAVDDAVDEDAGGLLPSTTATAPSRSWRAGGRSWPPATAKAGPRRDQGRRLVPFIKRFDLPRDAFEAVIDGVAMDLERTALRDVRRPARVLPAGRVGRRPHLHRDLRLPRPAHAPVRASISASRCS